MSCTFQSDGCIKATVYTRYGAVAAFSSPGGTFNDAFTALQVFIAGRHYRADVDRSYTPRGLARVSWEFAGLAWQQSQERA